VGPETHTQAEGGGVRAPSITIKGYNVSITGPDPGTVAFMRIPVKDLLMARGFIEEYKDWMAEVQEDWAGRLKNLYVPADRNIKVERLKPQDFASILHVGRGKNARLYLQIIFMPKTIMHLPNVAKSIVYAWLTKNALVIKNRPQNFYIVSEVRVKELKRVKARADEIINEANKLLKQFREENGEELKNLLRKYNLSTEPVDVTFRKYFHEVYLILTPVRVSVDDVRVWSARDPDVAEMFKRSLEEYVRRIADDIISRLTPVMDSVIKERKINVSRAMEKINDVKKILSEFGIEEIFSGILNDVERAVRDPVTYRLQKGYKTVDDWAVDVKRLVTMEW